MSLHTLFLFLFMVSSLFLIGYLNYHHSLRASKEFFCNVYCEGDEEFCRK